jgi:ABC-2 type transport system ATP-binding protein
VSVRVDAGSDGLMTALRSVEGARIEIEDIALRQPNLDEVFLALTGQPAEADDPIAAHAA